MLKVYNTLSREKEEFIPLEKGKVGIYVCGLTVQNYSHLGHIRGAVNYDVIRRYLEYKGYEVRYIQNFTDINEKIFERAREERMTPEELAEKYTQAYLEDIKRLNIKGATHYVKATDNIDEIIKMIEKIIENGYAYEVNGNVYFDVEKYTDYGKLSGRTLEEMQAGARVDIVEEKKNPLDFALWKKAPEGAIDWDSPWGRGWPGWHIECSAMSTKYLGESFDIHGGGSDLVFPHHENEIAQSETCTGKPFAKYWLHNGSVNLKGEKMSKSVGNFFTTRELLEKFTGRELRYYILTFHYRSPIEFSLEEVKNTSAGLRKIDNTLKNLLRLKESKTKEGALKNGKYKVSINEYKKAFEEAMDDDFNTARAIGIIHEFLREINSVINHMDFQLTGENMVVVNEAYEFLNTGMSILGIEKENPVIDERNTEILNDLITFILDVREEARKRKNWEMADMIRDGLNELGIIIKDTPQGVVWERVSE